MCTPFCWEVAITSDIQPSKTRFRWTYIALPVGFLLLSLILSGIFYPLLPSQIAYHLREGVPDNIMAKSAFIAWMVVPHILFTIMAFILVRVMMLGLRYAPPGETPIFYLLPLMGNLIALPQAILFIAMLQFFLYNAYRVKTLPLWIIALIILVLGAVFLIIYFIRIIRRFRNRKITSSQE